MSDREKHELGQRVRSIVETAIDQLCEVGMESEDAVDLLVLQAALRMEAGGKAIEEAFNMVRHGKASPYH